MKKIEHDAADLMFNIFFICLGLAMIIGGTVIVSIKSVKLNTYIHVDAVVVGHKVSKNTNEDGFEYNSYAEIAVFTVDGKEYKVTNPISATGGVKNVGEIIDIAYNPENPYDCVFNTKSNTAGLVMVFVIGSAFTFLGGVLLYRYFHLRRLVEEIVQR